MRLHPGTDTAGALTNGDEGVFKSMGVDGEDALL